VYHHCETCRVLSNSVEDVRDRLEAFTLLLGDVVGTGRPESFDADLRELQSLRMEHQALKAELEGHRAEHQLIERSEAKGASGN
jgi:hypothetical protein